MSKHRSRWQSQQWRAELAASSQDSLEDELFDAIVSAAALTARAGGQVKEVKRVQLLDSSNGATCCGCSITRKLSRNSIAAFGKCGSRTKMALAHHE
jgi:hypothetical protein